jgi:hypothetical protein
MRFIRRTLSICPTTGYRHFGVLGAVGPEKGARHVEALAQRIRDRQLPLRIVVVGYMDRAKRDQSSDHGADRARPLR